METRKRLITAIVVLSVLIVGLLGWLVWRNFFSSPAQGTISTFDECRKAEGSVIQLSFPETCVTKDGRSFTGPGNVEFPDVDTSQ